MNKLKQFLAVPFYGLFFLGCGITMVGWIFVELITGERFKEIKIVKDNEAVTTK